MKVAILCEFSGTVRDAFLKRGHDAVSCDLLPTEVAGPHIEGDCLSHDWSGYDLVICHPPCTHLAVSGARWFKDKVNEQREALEFVRALLALPVPRIALENPVSVISSRIRRPDQVVQPYEYGDEFTKTTCLWLKGLPKLVPTNIVSKGEFVIHGGKKLPKWYSNRERNRSKTFAGIAAAMATQWGTVTLTPTATSTC